MDPSSVTIVIPALNEAQSVGAVVAGLRERFPQTEVIVVNDGSADTTADVAAAAGARVLNHDHNCGYGAALRTGVQAASHEFVLFCDADGQHSAEDVGRIIEACVECDMVIGVRDQQSDSPITRRPGKFILSAFADFLAGQRIPDLNSGLRIVRRSILLKYMHLMPRGFSFSTTSTFALLKTHRRIKWIPITVRKRMGISTVQQWRHGPQTLMLMLRLSVLFEPLKVFLSVSAALFLLCILSLVIDIVYSGGFNVGDTTVILSIATVLVFMFGLLCDQVAALRREIHE